MATTLRAAGGGSRHGLSSRHVALYTFHFAGGITGGFVLGCILIITTTLPAAITFTIGAAGCAVLLLGDFSIAPACSRFVTRQVPAYWRRSLSANMCVFLYGVGLGTMFTTRIVSALGLATLTVAAAAGNIPLLIISAATMGGSRAAAAFAGSLAMADSQPSGRRMIEGAKYARPIGGSAALVLLLAVGIINLNG